MVSDFLRLHFTKSGFGVSIGAHNKSVSLRVESINQSIVLGLKSVKCVIFVELKSIKAFCNYI